MNTVLSIPLLIALAAGVFSANSLAQERIYRCGNEYTNTVPDAKARGCKLVEGGNVHRGAGHPPQLIFTT